MRRMLEGVRGLLRGVDVRDDWRAAKKHKEQHYFDHALKIVLDSAANEQLKRRSVKKRSEQE